MVTQTTKITEAGQISLGGYIYRIVNKDGSPGSVDQKVISAFPPIQTTGGVDYAIQQVLSTFNNKDQSGGIGVEEMDESKDGNRCWWSDLQLGYRGHNVLPPLATSLTIPTPTVAGNPVFCNFNGVLYMGKGSTLSKLKSDRTEWTVVKSDFADKIVDLIAGPNNCLYIFLEDQDSAASDTLMSSDDTEDITASDTYVKVAELYPNVAGTLRIKFDLKAGTPPSPVKGRIYRSRAGVATAVGTEQTDTTGAYVTKSEDISGWKSTDLVQLYASDEGTASVSTRNFRIYGTANPSWYMNTSESFTQTNVAGANLGIEWDSNLFKMDVAGNFWYTTTPNSATPTWTATGGITNCKAGDIKRLRIAPDAAGAPSIYALSKGPARIFDFVTETWTDTQVSMNDHPNGGMGAETFFGGLMISAGLAIKRYSPVTASELSVGLNTNDGLPAEYNGEITYLTKGDQTLFALVDASQSTGNSKSGVYGWSGVRWEHIWSPPTTLIDDCESVWTAVANDVGSAATDRASTYSYGSTLLDEANPVNVGGIINSIEVWANTNMTGLKVASFYGSGGSYTCRAVVSIGDVTAGSKQTFTGLSLAVEAGDFIGCYFATGTIEYASAGGTVIYQKSGDVTTPSLLTSFTAQYVSAAISLYATGVAVVASVDTTDFQVGAASAKLVVAAGAAAGDIIGYKAISSTDLSQHNSVSLRVKSSVALDAADLTFHLDNTAAIASPLENINIPAIAANTWTKVVLTLAAAASDTAIISVGIKMAVDKGGFTLNIDQIEGQTYDGAMNSAIVSSASSAFALYFDHNGLSYYIDQERGIQNVNKLPSSKYAAAGIHISPWFDAGSGIDSKNGVRRVLDCKGMSATETIVAKYRLNHTYTDLDTGWVTLGTITANGRTSYSFGSGTGISFDAIQFREDLVRGSDNTKSPDYTATLEYLKRKTMKAWSFTIDAQGDSPDGKSSADQEANLLTSVNATLLQEFTFRPNEDGSQTHYCIVQPFDSKVQSGDQHQGLYNINVVEP